MTDIECLPHELLALVIKYLAQPDLVAISRVSHYWRFLATQTPDFYLHCTATSRHQTPDEISKQLRVLFEHARSQQFSASLRLTVLPEDTRDTDAMLGVVRRNLDLLVKLDLDAGRQPVSVLLPALGEIAPRLRELRLAICPSIGGSLARLSGQIFRSGAPVLTKLTLVGIWIDKNPTPAFRYVQDLTIHAAPFGLYIMQDQFASSFPALRRLNVSEILPRDGEDIDLPNKSWGLRGVADESQRRTISVRDWDVSPSLGSGLRYPCASRKNENYDPSNWNALTASYGPTQLFFRNIRGVATLRVCSQDGLRQIGCKRRMGDAGSPILLSMFLYPLAVKVSCLTVHSIMFFSTISIASDFPVLRRIHIVVEPVSGCTQSFDLGPPRYSQPFVAFDAPRVHGQDNVQLAFAHDGSILGYPSGVNSFPRLDTVSMSCSGLFEAPHYVWLDVELLAMVATCLGQHCLSHRRRAVLNLTQIKIWDGRMNVDALSRIFSKVKVD